MKLTPRFTVRAALVLAAAGTIGAFGACKDGSGPGTTPPPPPPPPPLPAPTGLTATAVSQTRIDLAWTDNATTESGYKVERCSGAACTNFAQIGTNLAANAASYVDSVGLTASTQYSYRVSAFTATETSAFATATATTGAVQVTPGFTMVGAGEITSCASTGSVATANLIKGMLSDTNVIVFTTGNNLTDSVPGTTYADCFDPKWGEFKDRTYYTIGNRDYMGGRGIAGVHEYLGDRTIPEGQLGRSFDVGNWHIILLNTADWEQTSAQMQDPNGPMNMWLAADLTNVPASKCIMAISWERRIYTAGSGALAVQFNMKQAASLLYGAHADLLVSAKDAIYARFPKTNNDGDAAADGFRQFIVGTGGRSLHQAVAPAVGNPVEAQQGNNTPGSSNGVIKFTFTDNSYEWEFVPTIPGGFTDKSDAPVPCNQ